MHRKCVVLQNEMYPVVGWQWILFWLTVIRVLFNWEQNVHVISRVARSYSWMWSFTENTQIIRRSYGVSVLIIFHASCVKSVFLELRGKTIYAACSFCTTPVAFLIYPSVLQFAFVVCQTAIWAPLCFIFRQFKTLRFFELVLFRLWPRMWIFSNSWEQKARQALKNVVIGLIKGRESNSEVLLIISRQMIF